VPFFVTYHLGIESLKEIEQSVSYVMDGIIDLRFVPEFFEKGLLKREVRVRKMRGVAHHTGWKRFDVGKHGISTAPTER
jgi:KaiC/GvpD/RAD55 family RecA-like ATPase